MKLDFEALNLPNIVWDEEVATEKIRLKKFNRCFPV